MEGQTTENMLRKVHLKFWFKWASLSDHMPSTVAEFLNIFFLQRWIEKSENS